MEAASHIPAPELEEGSLSAAVNLLPPKYRAVIYLYYYEGYSSKEIARLLGRNPPRWPPSSGGPDPAERPIGK